MEEKFFERIEQIEAQLNVALPSDEWITALKHYRIDIQALKENPPADYSLDSIPPWPAV